MWTEMHRRIYRREGKGYPSDLRDAEWTRLAPLIPRRRAGDCARPTSRLRMEIVKRSDDTKGFVVLPRRLVVERTFFWFGRNRRLAKDFENLAETLATFVTIASIQLALRRIIRFAVGVGELTQDLLYRPPIERKLSDEPS